MKNGKCVKCSGKEIYCKDTSPKSSHLPTAKAVGLLGEHWDRV